MTRDVRLVVWFTLFVCACGGGTVSDVPDGSQDNGSSEDAGGTGNGTDDGGGGGEPIRPGDDAGPVSPEGCGDGERVDPEACDDGNLSDGDGCDLLCQVEAGWNCPQGGGSCVARCGDGLRVGGEACDDGNATTNDGCTDRCTLESGWVCFEPGAPCEAALCGDGTLAGNEECDDRDDTPGDGCSIACKVEPGWVCPAADQPCVASECGDGMRTGDEACDDRNTESADGCTAACDAVEPNYVCPPEGGACTRISVCGNGVLTSDEECDDRNDESGDGCSATCELEPGWVCPNVGAACRAAECGDGIVAGREECEDGNTNVSDGCADCRVTAGYACEPTGGSPASACHRTVCNDGKREGSEACDDGNSLLGDGCTPFCQVEPSCDNGPCRSACGDGIRLANDDEECDDGNTRDGDGCSASCELEPGYSCVDVESSLPSSFELPAIFRDFIRAAENGATRHPDFEAFSGSNATEGLVGNTLVNGKPSYTGRCQQGSANASDTSKCPYGAQTTSKANFNQWYGESTSVMRKKVTTVTMNKVGASEAYRNATFNQSLFPVDGFGWVAENPRKEAPHDGHNFGFTSEIRHYFEFKGGEKLTFAGDDDVWVFIGGKLALDLGGLHSKQSRTIVLDRATGDAKCFTDEAATNACSTATRDLNLVVGEVYEMALFHAERHTSQSNFDLTLTGFVSTKTECVSVCGDGVVTPDEVCDDGKVCAGGENAGEACADAGDCPGDGASCASLNDGSYGRCNPQCDGLGPHCGDSDLQTGEACDEGSEHNVGGYDGCTQTCDLGPYCGDGTVDGFYGEQCDLGATGNDGSYGACNADCSFGPRCGDGVVQKDEGEKCDDRVNRSAYGGCAPGCVLAPYCGDGKVDASRGEECDEGKSGNGGAYGTCTAQCKRSSRCGDGKLDAEREECDDGNLDPYDGCSPQCVIETIL